MIIPAALARDPRVGVLRARAKIARVRHAGTSEQKCLLSTVDKSGPDMQRCVAAGKNGRGEKMFRNGIDTRPSDQLFKMFELDFEADLLEPPLMGFYGDI